MRRLFFLAIFSLTFFQVFAQENADTIIAPKVLDAFNSKYKKAEISEWSHINGIYTITFFQKNNWFDVKYTDKAKWVETTIIIDFEQLPEAVQKSFESSKYGSWDLVKIVHFEQDGIDSYRLMVVSRSDVEKSLLYDKTGKLTEEQNIIENE